MNVKQVQDFIKEAQILLINNPQDLAHDITHHYRTLLNAYEILRNINEKCDLEKIELICWWHDVQITKKDKNKRVCEVTAEYLSSKFEKPFRDIILDSIMFHEFGSKPRYIEGKILQDADKLELLSNERFCISLNSLKANKMDKDYFLKKVIEVKNDWLPKMPSLYNFDISRTLHEKKLNQLNLEKYIEEIREI